MLTFVLDQTVGADQAGVIGLTCGAAAAVVATGTVYASTAVVMGAVPVAASSMGAVTGVSGGTVVVGQTMDLVKTAAERLGAQYYGGWTPFEAFRSRFGTKAAELVGAVDNAKWMIDKLMKNYRIVNIGLDPDKNGVRSLAIKVEEFLVRVWEGGRKFFQ